MCGIALCISKKGKHTGRRMWDIYKKQDHRGKQGYGFISIRGGKIHQLFRGKTEYEAKEALVRDNSEIILFHHRFPTSTKNVLGATHPIFVSHDELEYDYYVAHNGVIVNDDELKKKHNELGYVYTTEFTEKTIVTYKDGRTEDVSSLVPVYNDSEALAIELARFIEYKDERIHVRGGAAFWGVKVRKNSNDVVSLFFGKNYGRDLCIEDTNKWYIIASETGEDLEDMKLWETSVDGKDWTERELLMDEAKPEPKQTYNTFGYGSRSQEVINWDGVDKSYNKTKVGYESLENKYYTEKERDETGLYPSYFERVEMYGQELYVPWKFHKAKDKTVFGTDIEYKTIDNKTREELDDITTEYGKLQWQLESLEDYQASGFYQPEDEQRRMDLEARQGAIEMRLVAMGISPALSDEMCQLAYEMEDHDNAYHKAIVSPYALLD